MVIKEIEQLDIFSFIDEKQHTYKKKIKSD